MTDQATWWILFNAFVVVMLALDLGVFHRHAHVIKMREALTWTAVWITLGMLFNLGIYLGWFGPYGPEHRGQAALEFLTGYLLEYSLSVDNVFVFALLFRYFKVPPIYQHRVLFWGILGAVAMRAIMIFAGIALLQRFHWIIYIFGAILIFSGIKMWRADEEHMDPGHNPLLRFLQNHLPVTSGYEGAHFFTRHAGKFAVTPLFVVLVFVEWTDVVFAVDSIPAVLTITSDAFIVFTSNIMAILGLRSLYFALAGMMDRFHLLHYGLAAILVFVGTKMCIAEFYKVPTPISLAFIATVLALSVGISMWSTRGQKPTVPEILRGEDEPAP
jgi:tellurite resistance protein TerC